MFSAPKNTPRAGFGPINNNRTLCRGPTKAVAEGPCGFLSKKKKKIGRSMRKPLGQSMDKARSKLMSALANK